MVTMVTMVTVITMVTAVTVDTVGHYLHCCHCGHYGRLSHLNHLGRYGCCGHCSCYSYCGCFGCCAVSSYLGSLIVTAFIPYPEDLVTAKAPGSSMWPDPAPRRGTQKFLIAFIATFSFSLETPPEKPPPHRTLYHFLPQPSAFRNRGRVHTPLQWVSRASAQ